MNGVNELTFACGPIKMSIKNILQDILLISLTIAYKVDILKTYTIHYTFVTLLFQFLPNCESDST